MTRAEFIVNAKNTLNWSINKANAFYILYGEEKAIKELNKKGEK